MNKEKPDHHDAELVIKLYDLRRETVMRASRTTMMQFLPRSYEELLAVTQPTHPSNAAWRQVSSYWEMAWSFARHGVCNPDFLIENTTEGLFLYAKVQPYVEQYRKDVSPLGFRNVEWVATQCAPGRALFEVIKARVAKLAEARLAAAKKP